MPSTSPKKLRLSYRALAAVLALGFSSGLPLALSGARIVGHLRVTSAVSGKLFVRATSGEAIQSGALPFDADLPPGTYELTVQAPGHLPWSGVAGIAAPLKLAPVGSTERICVFAYSSRWASVGWAG